MYIRTLSAERVIRGMKAATIHWTTFYPNNSPKVAANLFFIEKNIKHTNQDLKKSDLAQMWILQSEDVL
jgi:hypothetical protein